MSELIKEYKSKKIELNILMKEFNFKFITDRVINQGNYIEFFDENSKRYFVINLEQIIYYTMKEIEDIENHIPRID